MTGYLNIQSFLQELKYKIRIFEASQHQRVVMFLARV